MVGAVDEGHLDVDHGVAGDDATLQGLLDALVDRGDVLLGHDAADDGVDELVALALLVGLHVDDRVTILAAATGLADELALGVLHGVASGLAVGDLRLAHVAVDLELTAQAVDDDLEVKLAHAGDDGLAGLLVGVYAEGRVLLGQLGETNGHLLLLGLGLGLNGNVDDGIGELDGLEDDGLVLVAEGVTGLGVLEANAGNDVAGRALLTVNTVVGVHLEDAAQALLAVLDGVVDIGACLRLARVHADVGELAHVRVGHDLEGQGREGLLGIRVTDLGLALEVLAINLGNVKRAGQVVHDGVEELLDALVLVGGAHEDGVELVGDDALADGGLEKVDGDVLLLEDSLHEVVREVGGCVEQLLALLLGEVGKLLRDGIHGLGVNHALGVFLEVPRGHGDQVDETPEVGLGAHGDLRGHGGGGEALLHRVDGVEEVRTHAVELVDEGDAGDVVLCSLTPHGLGLGLDAGDGVEHGDGTVKDAQAALDLGREVNVARGVDDLDDVILPEARGSRRGDGYAALLLLDHPVHGGSTVVDLTDLVGLAGVVENALGSGGLTGIDVGHDADVSQVFELVLHLCHILLPPTRSGSERTRGWPRPSCRGPRDA